MPNTIPITPQVRASFSRRVVFRTSRPSLIDLRFKGDAWVVADGAETVSVSLGDYALGYVSVTSLDFVSLNRTFAQVRTGQARRKYQRTMKRS